MHNAIVAIETSKHQNIGPHLRNSVAFGARYAVIVGSPTFSTHGAHGSQSKIELRHFYTWPDFFESLRDVGDEDSPHNSSCSYVCGITCRELNTGPILSTPLDQVLKDMALTLTKTNIACNREPIIVFVLGGREELSSEALAVCRAVAHVCLPASNRATTPSIDDPKPSIHINPKSGQYIEISNQGKDCAQLDSAPHRPSSTGHIAYECVVGIAFHKFVTSHFAISGITELALSTEVAKASVAPSSGGKFAVNHSIRYRGLRRFTRVTQTKLLIDGDLDPNQNLGSWLFGNRTDEL